MHKWCVSTWGAIRRLSPPGVALSVWSNARWLPILGLDELESYCSVNEFGAYLEAVMTTAKQSLVPKIRFLSCSVHFQSSQNHQTGKFCEFRLICQISHMIDSDHEGPCLFTYHNLIGGWLRWMMDDFMSISCMCR